MCLNVKMNSFINELHKLGYVFMLQLLRQRNNTQWSMIIMIMWYKMLTEVISLLLEMFLWFHCLHTTGQPLAKRV